MQMGSGSFGGLQDHRMGPVLDPDVARTVEHGGLHRTCVLSRNGGLQLEGGLGDGVGDHRPDEAAVPAILGAVGLIDLRPDVCVGRDKTDRMVDAADTYPTAAIAPGAAILAAGGTPVGPDIQIVTDADHQIGTARPGVWSARSGAMWISFAVPIVVSSLSLHPLISRSPLRRSQPVKSGRTSHSTRST